MLDKVLTKFLENMSFLLMSEKQKLNRALGWIVWTNIDNGRIVSQDTRKDLEVDVWWIYANCPPTQKNQTRSYQTLFQV